MNFATSNIMRLAPGKKARGHNGRRFRCKSSPKQVAKWAGQRHRATMYASIEKNAEEPAPAKRLRTR